MDVLSKEQRRKNMQNVRSKDTKAEIMLRKALWHKGIRYRKNYSKLPGKPDIVLIRQKIAIFIDGDFWHARWHQDCPGEQVQSNKMFWRKKLANNVQRDREINDILTDKGWLILRFWESDVKKNLDECLRTILQYCR